MQLVRPPAVRRYVLALAVVMSSPIAAAQRQVVPAPVIPENPAYDIVYVRMPRRGDSVHVRWPEVFHPGTLEPGSDLVLLHPDGREEVLVAAGAGAVTDPSVSFDGASVWYSYVPDARLSAANPQRGHLPRSGADIYTIHLRTRQVRRVTFQEFTPNTGAGQWHPSNPVDPPAPYNRLGYGILNLGPTPLAGGKVAFTSNRNAFVPPKGYSNPTLQLFVMDEDGSNVTPIAPMTIGSALHPFQLRDGRIMFSTFENQGLRDARVWGMWTIWPDGRQWEPLISAFKWANALHFATELSGSDVVVCDYYNLNNFGFGALYRFPVLGVPGQPRFHSPVLAANPPIAQTLVFNGQPQIYPRRMSFTPRGLYSLSVLTNAEDEAAPYYGGRYQGKFTQPCAAPGGDLLAVWSGGPVNLLQRPIDLPAVDAGIYLVRGGQPVRRVEDLVLIKNDPNFNEVWPRPVVPYAAIHGVREPVVLPWLPNRGDEDPELPAGTAYGLVGTSSLYKRESFPGHPGVRPGDAYGGLDVFNTRENDANSNWFTQGADAGRYSNSDIWAIRLVALEPNTHRSYGPNEGQHFFNHVNEKMRILGEVPVRKHGPDGNEVRDAEGNPDTSFVVKLPADTPFTFQTIDRNGMVLNMAQTWHQVRPGEKRVDCGGCHAHSQQPLAFQGTAANRPGYRIFDLAATTPLLAAGSTNDPGLREVASGVVDVEFYRDIRPLLLRSCVPCHTQSNATPPGNLVLDDFTLYDAAPFTGIRAPGDYMRLANDQSARWGYAPVIGRSSGWRQTNASRYVRLFQSRRSLLLWKLFGARLDGFSNADHPTERVPGDASTLPPGADANRADLDYTGDMMPPPGSAVAPLTFDDKLTFARWIDLGCPINTGTGTSVNFGWFLDDVRPTLTVSSPRPGRNAGAVTVLRVGFADANSGINLSTLSLKLSVSVLGRAADAELADLARRVADGVYEIAITPPLVNLTLAHVRASIADRQGNITRVDQEFTVGQ